LRTPDQDYVVRDAALLRQLMQCTGDGRPVSIRTLAREMGCSHGHLHNILGGARITLSHREAAVLCARIGVDLLVLVAPTGRTIPAPPPLAAIG
jgi:hypothetical protein